MFLKVLEIYYLNQLFKKKKHLKSVTHKPGILTETLWQQMNILPMQSYVSYWNQLVHPSSDGIMV